MDWKPWLEQGYVRPIEEGGFDCAIDRVHKAWDGVIAARGAYLEQDWEQADHELRQAFVLGLRVMLTREGLELAREFDMEEMQRLCREYFDTYLADSIFERARILSNLMPLDKDVSEETARLIRRSVAASSAFVSLVESQCYVKQDPMAGLPVAL